MTGSLDAQGPASGIDPDNAAQAEFWNGPGGQRWRDHQDRHDRMLQPVTESLLQAVRAEAGMRIVDVGCGGGDLARQLAGLITPGGDVLGLDISEPLIAFARERMPAGVPIRWTLGDATTYPFESGAADLVVSRFGVMFFADPTRSFANLRRALKPGGRIVFACWQEAKRNLWMIAPLREAAKHAPPLPEIGPEDPGPFSFADARRPLRALAEAGFVGMTAAQHDFDIDIALGGGVESAVETALSVGPTSRMLADQDADVRARAVADIRKALATRAVGDRVPLAAAIWIITAINPV